MRALSALAFAALSLGPLCGCGGHDSSECVANVTANAAYAGSYVATFTPKSGSARDTFTVNLTVRADGFVVGTVSDPGASAGATLGGDSFAGTGTCQGGKTYLQLTFQRSTAAVREQLNVSRDRTDSLDTSFTGSLSTNDVSLNAVDVSGTLTISPASTAVN